MASCAPVILYIVGTTTDTWNATLLIFILSVGRVDCSDEQNGRNPGNGSYPGEEGKNARNSLIITWIMGIIIFFEDMANSLDRRSYHETGNGSTEGIPRKNYLMLSIQRPDR